VSSKQAAREDYSTEACPDDQFGLLTPYAVRQPSPSTNVAISQPSRQNQKAKGDQPVYLNVQCAQGVTRKEDLHVAMATAQELQIRYSRPPVHHVSSLEAPKPSTAVPGPSKLPGTSTNNLPPQCHLFQYLNGRYLRLAHSLPVEMG
jgi:hypothetical protein